MDTQISIDLILFLRDQKTPDQLIRALWSVFQELSLFCNSDQLRVKFRRFYLSEREPESNTLMFLKETSEAEHNLPGTQLWRRVPSTIWEEARESSQRTYNSARLARLVPAILGEQQSATPIVVVDQSITPPKNWRYILWNNRVVSIAPMDPLYWHTKEPNRVAVIKQRVRAACLQIVGGSLGLRCCNNENCYMYGNVDSVERLDVMVKLREGHRIQSLTNWGFDIPGGQPQYVQKPVKNPEHREVVL